MNWDIHIYDLYADNQVYIVRDNMINRYKLSQVG